MGGIRVNKTFQTEQKSSVKLKKSERSMEHVMKLMSLETKEEPEDKRRT